MHQIPAADLSLHSALVENEKGKCSSQLAQVQTKAWGYAAKLVRRTAGELIALSRLLGDQRASVSGEAWLLIKHPPHDMIHEASSRPAICRSSRLTGAQTRRTSMPRVRICCSLLTAARHAHSRL